MIAVLVALVMATSSTQPCGDGHGTVRWWGSPSADLSPIGYGNCTGTIWIDPIDVEVDNNLSSMHDERNEP